METVLAADYCVLVVEPTAFGFHNFQMVYELVNLLHKPCGVVINKRPSRMSRWNASAQSIADGAGHHPIRRKAGRTACTK